VIYNRSYYRPYFSRPFYGGSYYRPYFSRPFYGRSYFYRPYYYTRYSPYRYRPYYYSPFYGPSFGFGFGIGLSYGTYWNGYGSYYPYPYAYPAAYPYPYSYPYSDPYPYTGASTAPVPYTPQPSVDVTQSNARGDFGTLSIRVMPSDASIVIDGEVWDRPSGADRFSIDLVEGQHRLEVRRQGYVAYQRTIDVPRGRTVTLNIGLTTGGSSEPGRTVPLPLRYHQ